jgi:heme-degrading monooxygenase HmoA
MYAVIFKAEINEIDNAYSEMAAQMRDLAQNKYGCIEFTAVTEGANEIAISYWHTLEQIQLWKNAVNHTVAQELGRSKGYKEYQVQVVKIIREYKKT